MPPDYYATTTGSLIRLTLALMAGLHKRFMAIETRLNHRVARASAVAGAGGPGG
jgi:hypothetical protein